MDDDQQFCLRWNNHQSTLISVFDTLLENETLVDCTLAAEGKFLKAHKVVLSACSPYFATLLQEQYDKHPIFILKDVKYQELRAMMDYMYRGEVNISQDQLAALLKAAESLQIKGLSDNRTGGGSAPKPEATQQHHRGKLGGAYTLEQTKRARLGTASGMDVSGDVSGSREGSSSPSRRRRKVRRRSMENDVHDNSNSSVLQAASNQSILQQSGAGLAVSALVSTQLASGPSAGSSSQTSSTQQQPLTSTNVTKKTESAKLTSSTAAPATGSATSAGSGQQGQAQNPSDAINTENVQAQSQGGAQGVQGDDEDMDSASGAGGVGAVSGSAPASGAAAVHTGVVVKQLASVVDKSSNHKQKIKDNSVSSVGSEMVIEPKAEYDDDAHDENVEDLTLDEEDMTMEELDQTAGTSQGGEGSSQTYATWQHDRSQDELGLMAQDAQQRDPQDMRYDFNHSVFGSCDDADMAGKEDYKERFHCAVCNKSYLRKRHLQRHMRDECIGIPPRFNCEFCSSRFRRKYHMVRHLVSKHGIPPAIAQMTTGSGSRTSSGSSSLDMKGGGLGGLQSLGGGGGGGGGSSGGDCGASVGSSHNGCESPIPENLSLRKENYENEPRSRCNSPLPPHIMPIPTYGLTGAITAISAAAAVVEEQAAAAAAAAAAGGEGKSTGHDEEEAAAEAAGELSIKPEPVTPGKVQHLLNEEWNMKLGLQIISNSLLKERLMNTMPFAYNNN
ncbi:longitudinals lacking protein, isoforms H/M/V isoform X7 [Drosophila bipectinata]|uniref:longitudinals lacking protein, isoforms H/M/V isoform X7 n=1 Tax=Drosophila bipectinata TaxID=42026 RepID=UPI0007E68CEF|nr:longitudinals lacking protein, isoforms H/M/V isoform X7 [Drosophila bipectinata]